MQRRRSSVQAGVSQPRDALHGSRPGDDLNAALLKAASASYLLPRNAVAFSATASSKAATSCTSSHASSVRHGVRGHSIPDLARKAVYRAWQLGAVVFYVGGNVLEVTPPLTISVDEAGSGVAILLQAIAEAEMVSDEEVSAFAGW